MNEECFACRQLTILGHFHFIGKDDSIKKKKKRSRKKDEEGEDEDEDEDGGESDGDDEDPDGRQSLRTKGPTSSSEHARGGDEVGEGKGEEGGDEGETGDHQDAAARPSASSAVAGKADSSFLEVLSSHSSSFLSLPSQPRSGRRPRLRYLRRNTTILLICLRCD